MICFRKGKGRHSQWMPALGRIQWLYFSNLWLYFGLYQNMIQTTFRHGNFTNYFCCGIENYRNHLLKHYLKLPDFSSFSYQMGGYENISFACTMRLRGQELNLQICENSEFPMVFKERMRTACWVWFASFGLFSAFLFYTELWIFGWSHISLFSECNWDANRARSVLPKKAETPGSQALEYSKKVMEKRLNHSI